MNTQLARAAATAVTAAAVALAGPTGTAAAAPPDQGEFEDRFRRVEQSFCGTAGLTAVSEGVARVRFHEQSRGRDRLAYYMEHARVDVTVTNQANGKHVRAVERTVEKDLEVTDNGDGTLTILVLATGNFVVYDSAGRAIARNPGQTRFEILIDHGGTPSDISDDEFLAFLGVVKESTGRSDDFCAAVLPAIS